MRNIALSLRPRALPEIMVAARQFGVDLVANPSLVWLVDLCLACDYLPVGWSGVPKEDMSELAASHDRKYIEMKGYLSSKRGEAAKAAKHARDVTWLPPLERLRHVATTGAAPPQFSHHMCSLVTERHPLSGFVRTVLGVDAWGDSSEGFR